MTRFVLGIAVTAVLAVAAVSCGGDTDDAAPPGSMTAATRGEQVARSNGCAGCHGSNFSGAAGPGWIGLAGSQVTLADGTTVVADDEYLTRAITDPAAQVSEGYSLKMPANDLTAAEVADIVAFINSLADG